MNDFFSEKKEIERKIKGNYCKVPNNFLTSKNLN